MNERKELNDELKGSDVKKEEEKMPIAAAR